MPVRLMGWLAVLSLWVVTLGGCVGSLHPLYENEEQLAPIKLFTGVWQNERYAFAVSVDFGASLAWVKVLEPGDPDEADGTQIPGGFVLIAGLMEINGRQYVDVAVDQVLSRDVQRKSGSVESFLLPLHMIFRIERDDQSLRLTPIHPTKLKAYLEAHPDAVAYTVPPKVREAERDEHPPSVLLTARPAQLQQFLREHGQADIWLDEAAEAFTFTPGDRDAFHERWRALQESVR